MNLSHLKDGPIRRGIEAAQGRQASEPTAYSVTFRVNGAPKGQPRPRRSASGGVYNPSTANGWKAAVKAAVKPHLPRVPLSGPVSVDVDVLLHRPDRLCRRKDDPGELPATCKPDRDNLDKATLDALTDAGLWNDDAQVCDGRIRKLYHAIGDEPGARITVKLIT